MNILKFLANWVIKYIVVPIDSALATPANNAELFSDINRKEPYPGRNASNPYPNINDSPHAAAIKEGALALALLSIIGNLIIQFYKRVRKKEAISPYFFFEKCPGIEEYLKNAPGNGSDNSNKCAPDVLLATAYFYNPDLSSLVLAWRRAWATLTRSSRYLSLNNYLRGQLAEGKKKKEILGNIYQQINENLASYINAKDIYGTWIAEQQTGKWIIHAKEVPSEFLKKLDVETKKTKEAQNKTIAQRVGSFIAARFDELVKSSFVFWVSVFIFYLLPGVGVLGAVVWPPILIAGVFLLGLWISKGVIKTIQARKTQLQPNEGASFQDDNALLLEVIHHIQVAALSQRKTDFGNSRLYPEIDGILEKRKNAIFVGAILNGFIGGFFQVSFVSWLLFAAIGLAVSISPLGLAIIAGSTLLSSISWGIYSAYQHFKSKDAALQNRDKLWSELKEPQKEQQVKIPDMSLREYDRLFRRGDSNQTIWTGIKQVFKRTWVGFVGIGTGILVLKLSAYGVTTAILSAVGISASIAFFPILGVFLGGGLLYAAWRVYEYHLESQEAQLDNVINSFSHPLFRSNPEKSVVSPRSVEASNNETVNQPSEDSPSYIPNHRRIRSQSCLMDLNDVQERNNSLESEYVSKLKRSQSCSGDLNRKFGY